MLSLRGARSATKQSPPRGRPQAKRDCFAEPVIGPAKGRTRWLAMTPAKGCYVLSRDQPMKQLGVDVAAGQHRHHDLAFDVELAGEQRREPDGAAGLDHQLQL